MGVLDGLKVVEIMSSVGPGKFSSMMLAEMGADVIIIERPADGAGLPRPHYVFNRGKRSVMLDLKKPAAVQAVMQLIERSDVLLEGMRPGVMERLGLGPQACFERHPALVYGRLTGWGQSGPLSHAPGFDGTFVSLSGALSLATEAGERPEAPPGLLGDVCGGALYLALGVLAAVMRARIDGRGQVVDAAMVDGAANMLNWELSNLAKSAVVLDPAGRYGRGQPWIRSYRCADGEWVRVEACEPGFYTELIARLGLDNDARFVNAWGDAREWPWLAAQLQLLFSTKTRAQWATLLEGSIASVVPVLSPPEAAAHRHNVSRGVYEVIDGVLQASPAPRFSATASERGLRVPPLGAHTREVLTSLDLPDAVVAELVLEN
ncbi:CaiB/BaiF CoA-transferase family protein [Burkholderia sp. BCC1977]|uniref:CaiB/BaiF CoA transferase family protein n=1 Tax=Burkholderia sp. BCC1977 TaxID=2817440 RepID=UPI002ABDC3F0|nr:CaiB/BaiF CoA-transferase family protein [Burkholderia sp. BCC1977]